MILVLSLVFAIAYGTRRITTTASTLHTADEMLRSATVARAQVALAVHSAAVQREFKVNAHESVQVSLGEAVDALSDLSLGAEDARSADVGWDAAADAVLAAFDATGREIVNLLDAQESLAAQELANDRFDAEFRDVVDEIVELRDVLRDEVRQSDANLGRVGNGARFLVAFLVPTAVILIYRELTKRQQKQTELERRLQAEKELGKARDEFVANASHELRTPLTSIYGLALLLEEDPAFAESETATELLDMIISESADLSRMVEDLLTTARLDAGALHYTFDNASVTEEIEEVVGPLLRSGQEIAVIAESGIVRVDQLRFRQILRNLLSNAKKYGGPTIRVRGFIEEHRYLTIVEDDGEGIPRELEDRLFQRYIHQGHQPLVLGSVGLGLSIVRALAEGQGGTVHYERADGWTRFVVVMPLVARIDGPNHPPIDSALEGPGFDLQPGGLEDVAPHPESAPLSLETPGEDG